MGFIETAKRVIMAPGEVFAEQAQERDIKTGFIIMGIVFLIGLVGNLMIVSSSSVIESGLKEAGLPEEMAMGALMVLIPIVFIVSLAVLGGWCGIMHLIVKLMGGSGSYKGILTCFFFMQIISLIFMPISFATLYMTMHGISGASMLTSLLSLVQIVWFVYLVVLAIKKVYDLSNFKAIMVMLIPGIAAFLGLTLIVVMAQMA